MWDSVDVYRLTSLESMQQWSDDSIAAGEPINNFTKVTLKNERKFMQRESYTVIGDSLLREIIRSKSSAVPSITPAPVTSRSNGREPIPKR